MAGQAPTRQAGGKAGDAVRRCQQFRYDWPGQPEPGRQPMAEPLANWDGVAVQAGFDLGRRPAGVNVGAVTQWSAESDMPGV